MGEAGVLGAKGGDVPGGDGGVVRIEYVERSRRVTTREAVSPTRTLEPATEVKARVTCSQAISTGKEVQSGPGSTRKYLLLSW